MEQIIFNNIRVQLFSNRIIRLEYAKSGKFCDENTFFIPDKGQYANTEVVFSREENVICFGDYELYIPENAKSLAGISLEKCGKKVYTYKKLKNSGELPPLDKTPEVFAISDNPRIIVPEGGYSKNRKGNYKITENVQDIYLILCRKDAKQLRKLYVELTGKPELVRLSTLGGWNSKYYAYNEEEAKQLILDYERHGVPLDVMVIDTDWRSCEHGWGYDINTKLFPDMKRFLDFAHGHGVEICFNDHPEPQDGLHVFKPKEIAYREKNLQALMKKGLDIWWYDRNWSSSLISPTKDVRWETFGLYIFHEVTANYLKSVAKDNKVYRRPVIMGNVVNIANGCYQGVLDSASHRFSVQWTGDIQSEPESLAQEVENMIKCGNNGIAYANADCGGHLGNPNKDGFIRWMQFGVLSPVFRPHCTNYVVRFREPWAYDEQTLKIVRAYNKLRYRLLPVIYKNAYESYVCGQPIFKALGYEYPSDKKAAKLKDEYMLGNNILIKPIAGGAPQIIKKSNFTKPVKATYYNGTQLEGEPIATAEYNNLEIVLNHTPPEKGVPVYNFSARFETEIKFEKDVELIVRSDDGATVWIDGEKVFEDKTLHSAMNFTLRAIEGGKPHKIEIEYFQAGGEAAIALCYYDMKPDDNKTAVYLPEGKWLDVFDGKIYTGNKTIRKEYGLKQMPLFVRLGAVIPLAHNAKNTKEQKWDKLVYDFYPCKDSSDVGYLYEDDTQTTAYKSGQFRKSAYKAYFSEEENAYVLKLFAAEGKFSGEKCFKNREIAVKYHIFNGTHVHKVTVNGVENGFVNTAKDTFVFPLGTGENAPDGRVVYTSFKTQTDKDYEIKFYL